MVVKKYILAAFLLSLTAFSPLWAQICDCVNTGNCPVGIQDNGTFQGTLDVTVNGANDLGVCPLNLVCFTIEHTWVGDLSVTLTSPSGLNYLIMADANNGSGGCGTSNDNIDVCIGPGTGNPLTANTEYICNTGGCSVGTCCLNGVWTMPCGGVTDPVSGAVQAPNCDLNDFNQPGAPANGTWTMTINDICGSDVGQLLNFSLFFSCGASCISCEANGGTLNDLDVQACQGNPSLDLNPIPVYSGGNQMPPAGDYDYAWVIALNGTIQSVGPSANMSALPPGNYTLCGFSYAILSAGSLPTLIGMDLATAQTQFSSSTAPFCGDFSDDCIDVTIGPPVPPTFIDTALCNGACITVGNVPVCASGSVTLTSYLGCDSVVNVTITPVPPVFSNLTFTVCTGECVFENNQQYCPPGPAIFTVPNWQGCDSTVTINFVEIPTFAIITPSPPLPLSCDNPTVTLDALASIPTGSLVQWQGPGGFSSSSDIITVNQPGTYTLTITNNSQTPACTSEASVDVVDNINPPVLQLNSDPPAICLGETFDLSSLSIIDINNNNPVITFHSGTPATIFNELPSTSVAPTVTTTYYALASIGTCSFEMPIVLTVNPVPVASFTATSPLCLDGGFSTVTFTGTASPNATFNWNFGGGTASPGTGPGPHTVTWSSGGTQTITLIVVDNDCESNTAMEEVQVDVPIPEPLLNCSSTGNSITFFWDPIPDATSYIVTVISGPSGVMTGPETYLVTNLIPNQPVTISVEAVSGNECPNSSAQISCSAQDCPPVTITMDPVDDICLTPSTANIQLFASQNGGDGSGTYTWSGPGVNPITGIFNPASANPGANTIVVTYEEGTCQYNESIVINVFPTPTATFTVVSPICSSNGSIVNYTGNAGSGSTFNWNFNGGTAVPGTGPGPHTVTWPTGGTYTVSLMVTSNGCPSASFTQNVVVGTQLPAPQVTCISTTSSVEFVWNDIPGASGYTVNVVSGGTGTATSDTSMLFTGLLAGDAVTIQVIALDPGPCNDVSVQATCIAQDCPTVNVNITPVPPICLSSTAASVTLQATVTGNVGSGTYTWAGNGVSAAGVFDPVLAGAGVHLITVVYEEGDCAYTEDINITVVAQPIASFTAPSPVCVNNDISVSYTGSVLPGMSFDWDFGAGSATPGVGQGPHLVSWAAPGAQPISLIVTTAQGCVSEPFTTTVQVDQTLVAPVISCNTTTTSIEFSWPDVPGATSYVPTLVSGTLGTQTSQNTYLITGLAPGDQATILLTISNGGACPNVTAQQTCIAQDCPTVTIDITPVTDIICLDGTEQPFDMEATTSGGTGLGNFVWSGTGVSPSGTFDPAQALVGANTLTATYTEGTCTYNETIVVNVFAQPIASFTAAAAVCEGESTVITYTGTVQAASTYTWDFGTATATPGTGVGPHTVSWADSGTQPISLTVVSPQGCVSAPFSTTVQVDEPLIAPLIDCNTTLNSIEFSWPDVAGATSYQATLISGSPGMQTSQNTYLINGLQPGDQATVSLTVSAGGACPDVTVEQTCTAQDCPNVNVTITPVTGVICLDANAAPFDLEASTIGGTGLGTLVWSGTGVSPSGTFDPQQAIIGANNITVTYTEGTCVYTQTTVVNVAAQPVASFTAPAAVCEGEGITVSYNGTNQPGNVYDWDFGTATAVPGTGVGPHTVSWADIGIQQISLTVTSAQGCASEPFSSTVQVDEPLIAPLINCNTTISSIEFVWLDVVGATDYDVVVIAGDVGTQTSPNTYSVNGLMPNETVTIELTVNSGNTCPPVSVQQTCIAQDCLPILVSVDPVTPICIGSATPVQLTATLTGAAGGGAGTWSGPGTSATGIFNPTTAGVGTHQVVYVYVENNCTYQAPGSIQVLPTPTANFSASATICIADAATVTYTGSAPANATYAWNFDGGTAVPGTGPGPHQVSFPATGNYEIALIVTQNGCTSSQVTQPVQVDPELVAPDIDCNTTTQSIEFTWGAVPNATDYEVTVLAGQSGTQTSPTSYAVNGLQPNDVVTIELSVSGNTACPPVTVQETCVATDCPTVTIDITPVDPICLSGNVGTIQLEATVTGGTGTAGTWSGPGVSASGVFNPNAAGVGSQTIMFVYEENSSCSYDQSIQVELVAPPVADAGPDGEITCQVGQTSFELGNGNSSTGANIGYGWTAGSGNFPGDADVLNPVVSVPGTYTLTVNNTSLPNCSDTDVAVVSASQDIPQPQLTIVPVSCFGENDGAISVANVTGGEPPYLYAINGGTYGSSGIFQPLAPGVYEVSVIDASGCEASLTIDITQPQELNVELVAIVEGGGNIIRLGDTTELQALVSLPADSLDNVQWYPSELVSCDTCLNTFTSPTNQTTFTITVESNGCVAEDNLTLFVKKDRPVYVPSAFSPGGDGNNEYFMIYAGKEVVRIKSFLVFDRWGETVFQYFNFEPNNPAYGWDGKHRGEPLNTAVFTWFAEVEFIDGKVELYEGGVTLMR